MSEYEDEFDDDNDFPSINNKKNHMVLNIHE